MKKEEFISAEELRANFERMAVSIMFDIKRNPKTGDYASHPRDTFSLWIGYWTSAKEYGVISPQTRAATIDAPVQISIK